jgi:hypothetical protein
MRFACCPRAMGVALIFAALFGPPTVGQDVSFPRDHHPWGHFPVNSWKRVRTTAESLDEKGHVVSSTVTETVTKLVAVDESAYTLQSEATVDVASRRIAAAPQTSKYGYYGETPGKLIAAKHTGDASLTIDGHTIPCELRQVVLTGDSGKLINTIYYSSEFPPFVLRRESSVEGVPDEKRTSTLVEVIALDLPQRIRGELKQASYVKTTQKFPQGSKVTLEVHCDEVPGGVAAHWASETDSSGRVVRRSTLELIDYGLPSLAGQPQPSFLRRPMRPGKAARRMDPR